MNNQITSVHSLSTTFLKIRFQATPSGGYKIKGHTRLTKESCLVDKESLFNLCDYLKFKTKTSSPVNRLLRTGQAGGNTAKDSSPLYIFIQYLGAESVNIVRGTD